MPADGCPAFFRLLTEAQRNDVPFDGIGIQAHQPRTMRFPLDRVQEILDQYATFGKGLHITEFTPASSGQEITGSHRDGMCDEAAQTEYAVKFYRVCFAHPAVQATVSQVGLGAGRVGDSIRARFDGQAVGAEVEMPLPAESDRRGEAFQIGLARQIEYSLLTDADLQRAVAFHAADRDLVHRRR